MKKIKLEKNKTYNLIFGDEEIKIKVARKGIEINNPCNNILIKPQYPNQILLQNETTKTGYHDVDDFYNDEE